MTEPEFAAFAACWNEGRFFEAHEVLEGLWIRTRERGHQGLIQVAVALHHLARGNRKGARTMAQRALERLDEAAARTGPFDKEAMRAFARRLLEDVPQVADAAVIASRPKL